MISCKARLLHNTRAGSFGVHLLTALLYSTTAVRLLKRNYAGNFGYAVDMHLMYSTISCKAWLSHITRAGSFGVHLPTALLYSTTAVRLLRRKYAVKFWYVVDTQLVYSTISCKAWLSHNTKAGAFGFALASGNCQLHCYTRPQLCAC
jgi:hypothetical protein